MDEEVDVSEQLYTLKAIYEGNLDPLAEIARANLNTMIYYFEKFLDSHKNYEGTKLDLMKLNKKLEKLEGEQNEND